MRISRQFIFVTGCIIFSTTRLASSQQLSNIGAEEFLTDQCYPVMGFQVPWGTSFSLMSNIASDDVFSGGNNPQDRVEFHKVDSFSMTANNPVIVNTWQKYYMGIDRSNFLLDNMNSTEPNNERLKAEAMFLRAMYYFNLVRLYGGVPIISNQCQPFNAMVRNSVAEVYNFIESDLLTAIPNLPLKSELESDQPYRATSGAARTLLAKAYLYQQDWSHAIEQLNEIVNSNEYNLLPVFSDLWKEENEHNAESIYELEFNDDPNFMWANYTNRGNLDIQMMGVMYLQDNDGIYEAGWGFTPIDSGLVKAFVSAGDSVRLQATVLFADTIKNHGGSLGTCFENTGYFNKKYSPTIAHKPSYMPTWGQNEVVFRFAEVLLMRAEVNYRLGNIAAAQGDINSVRARVNLVPIALTGTALLDAIQNERRLELALESNRFFDLLRWNKATEVLGKYGFNAGTDELWPVPQNILNSNPAMVQNPGFPVVTLAAEGPVYVQNPFTPALFSKDRESYDSVLIYTYNTCRSDSVNYQKGIFTLNADHNPVEFHGFYYQSSDKQWIESFKELYEYNDDGNRTKMFVYQYNFTSDKWQCDYGLKDSYNGAQIDTEILYMSSDSKPAQKTEYIWNYNNTQKLNLLYYYDNSLNNWVKSVNSDSKYVYSYDHNHLIDSVITYMGDNDKGTWQKYSLEKFNYDNNNNVILSNYYTLNGSDSGFYWGHKYEYVYNGKDIVREKDLWLRNDRPGYNLLSSDDWNSHGASIIRVNQGYDYNMYLEASRAANTTNIGYNAKKSIVSISENTINAGSYFRIYPNPVLDGNATIENNSKDKAYANVYGMNGILISSEIIEPGSNKISINNPGIYLISIISNKSTFNYKLIVQ